MKPCLLYRLAFVLSLFLFCQVASADRGGVLFYSGFEGNGDALAHGSANVEWKDGAPEFGEGKKGKALLSGDGKSYATYDVANNVLLNRGSIEFWFSPQDWNGDDNNFHVFFEAQGPGWLLVYKYYNPKEGLSGLFIVSADKRTWLYAKQDFAKIKPHEWHHLVATWSTKEIKLYLDGKPSEVIENQHIPSGLGGRFTVGDRPSFEGQAPPNPPRNARSLIDEFYIYDRPLSDAEVAWSYQHAVDRPAGEDLPTEVRRPVLVTPHFIPQRNQVSLDVQVSGMENFTGTARLDPASSSTTPPTTNPLATSPVTMAGIREGVATLPFDNPPRGDYRITVDVRDAQGKSVGTGTANVMSAGPAVWRGNKIGIPTTPPPPWTPLKLNARSAQASIISCWGRDYTFGATGFPSQITAQGKKLLRSPVALQAIQSGKPVQWNSAPQRVLGNSSIAIAREGSATSSIGTMHWKCTAEFDGMLRYDIEIEPKANTSVDSMEMRVPISAEYAGLQYTLEPSGIWNKGVAVATPQEKGTVFKNAWTAYWWLGDEERGLAGWCETDEAWDKIDRPDGFRIERTNDSVDAVWSFIGSPKTLDKPWKFTFGLQATPVKPLPQKWRSWRVAPFLTPGLVPEEEKWLDPRNKNVHILWPTPDVMRYYGYPEADPDGKLKKATRELQAHNAKLVPYTLVNAISSGSPEGRVYGEAWTNDAVFPTSTFSDVAVYNAGIRGMSPAGDWPDFIAWSADRFIRENGIDGLYHDLSHLLSSGNRALGFGYVRDGKVRPSYPIFGQREVYKRIYTLLKQYGRETGKETFMMQHMSTNYVIPILGFSDASLDGEHFQSLGVKDNYLDFVTLGGLRAEYMGHNYGVMPFFLPELQESAKEVGPTRNLLGLSLLHDFRLWPLWSNINEVHRVYSALDAFGIADATLLGYWKNTDSIRGQSDAVKCTAYRHPTQGTLLCIFNTTRQPQQAKLTLKREKLGVGKKPDIKDALDAKPVKIDNNLITLEVPPLDFRLITIH